MESNTTVDYWLESITDGLGVNSQVKDGIKQLIVLYRKEFKKRVKSELNNNEIEVIKKALKKEKQDINKLKGSYKLMKEDLSEYRQVVVFAENKLAEQDEDISVIDGLLEKLKNEGI